MSHNDSVPKLGIGIRSLESRFCALYRAAASVSLFRRLPAHQEDDSSFTGWQRTTLQWPPSEGIKTHASGEISSSYIKVKHKARIKASCSSRELRAALQPQHHLQDQMQCHSLDLLFALTGTLADLEGTVYRSWCEEQQQR